MQQKEKRETKRETKGWLTSANGDRSQSALRVQLDVAVLGHIERLLRVDAADAVLQVFPDAVQDGGKGVADSRGSSGCSNRSGSRCCCRSTAAGSSVPVHLATLGSRTANRDGEEGDATLGQTMAGGLEESPGAEARGERQDQMRRCSDSTRRQQVTSSSSSSSSEREGEREGDGRET